MVQRTVKTDTFVVSFGQAHSLLFLGQHWGVSRGRPLSPFHRYGRIRYLEHGRHQAICAVTDDIIWQSDSSIKMGHLASRGRIRRVGASWNSCEPCHQAHAFFQSKNRLKDDLTLFTLGASAQQ